MAKIEELINEIANDRLREALQAEVKELKKTIPFGLVFEEHLPERVRLPNLTVKVGELVSNKREAGNRVWRVTSINGNTAKLEAEKQEEGVEPEKAEMPFGDLVVVRNFGEPIYPALVPVDRVERGGADKPWHVLINADNFHALQLLLYCYEGKVDVIYIDPPYNSGARDWKYNNDYVDKNDLFRHSKWLSMMKKRLTLAGRLLRNDGLMIITIDENEVHHLWCLLESMFPGDSLQQATIVVNPKGVTQGRFSRVEEYAIHIFRPGAMPVGKADDYLTPEPDEGFGATGTIPRWKGLLRSGTNARREDRENMFYPILIDSRHKRIVDAGDPMLGGEPDLEADIDGFTAAWPVRTRRRGDTKPRWGNWGVGHLTLRRLIRLGFVRLGEYDKTRKTWAITYLSQRLREQLEGGVLEIVARDPVTNVVDVRYADIADRRIKTVWKRSRHDAGAYGSSLLAHMLGTTETFSFPKSLYAVEDTILPFVRDRPAATILDFFAGSATTFHATCLMNLRDGGSRRSISVTNNEVSVNQEIEFARENIFPSDLAFERAGIANAVAWPRMKAALSGKSALGDSLEGSYLEVNQNGEAANLSDGFAENAEYFRLDFLDPNVVARGDAFKAVLPIFWLIAGANGKREDSKGSKDWFVPKYSPFAVLIEEKKFKEFMTVIDGRLDIKWLFFITDSEENFALMRRTAGKKYRYLQLYKSYLENFRIYTQGTTREKGE
ncbi:MAG: DNA methyltransferase [Pyrinomonadaceae bacterium]